MGRAPKHPTHVLSLFIPQGQSHASAQGLFLGSCCVQNHLDAGLDVYKRQGVLLKDGDDLLPVYADEVVIGTGRRGADWLLRFYQFEADEILDQDNPNFNPYLDPKCNWAVQHYGCLLYTSCITNLLL